MSKRSICEWSTIQRAARWLPLLFAGMFAAGIYGQTSGVPPLVSGDCSVASNGVMTCTKTNAVAFAASATTDTTNATNISSGTLPVARTAAISGDVTKTAGSAVSTVTGVNGAAVPTVAGIAATNASGQIVAATSAQTRALICSGTPSQYYYCDPSTGTWAAIASAPAVSSAVSITGGAINGTSIGATTANTGAFTALVNSGQMTSTASSAASAPARLDTGTLYSGGTSTTTTPHWYINQGATAPTSWNINGTHFGINAASGCTGNFLDFHVNGATSRFSMACNGSFVAAGGVNAQAFTATMTTGGFIAPLYTPASSTTGCTTGTFAWEASYLYVCRATNTWSRAALSTF